MTNTRRSPIARFAFLSLTLLCVPLALGLSAAGCSGGGSSGKVNNALVLSPATGSTLTTSPVQNRFYQQRFSITNGAPGDVYRFAEIAGGTSLPPGFFLSVIDSTGKALVTSEQADIIGFPALSGPGTISFEVFQQNNNATVPSYDLTTLPALATSALTLTPVSGTILIDATVAAVYTNMITIGNGTPVFAWKFSYGSLPPGVNFNPNPTGSNTAEAEIRGTPTEAGTWIFAVEASDSASPQSFNGAIYQITVNP
ncbi:MAG: hypothetical protein JKY65_21060 [Planctomycetes bacterium]|nr:hypothetical protein [Planctomycetota bacterium]